MAATAQRLLQERREVLSARRHHSIFGERQEILEARDATVRRRRSGGLLGHGNGRRREEERLCEGKKGKIGRADEGRGDFGALLKSL